MRWLFSSSLLLAALCGTSVQAQQGRTSVTGLGSAGTDNRTQGLEQSGSLSSSAAISRDENAFIGGSGGSFLGSSGTATGQRGSGNMSGLGLGGLSGLGGLGGIGGLGGFGGGGFGGGLGGGGFGGMGRGGFGMPGMQGMQNQGRGNNAAANLRIPVRLGFSAPATAPTAVSTRFVQRLRSIPGLETIREVEVTMDGRTAVLQGIVPSQRERDLIARLALLEPGISDVRNELAVRTALPEATP